MRAEITTMPNLASVTVAGTDKVVIQDASDSDNLKTVTAQSIANLASGGAPAFNTITGGTNTTAAMVVGTGASLAASGSGTIVATSTTGNAATVTTNANLTGDVTSTGNATAIASNVIVDADINASAGILLSKTNISLTTTGSGGAATLNTTTGVLNIPQYSGGGGGGSQEVFIQDAEPSPTGDALWVQTGLGRGGEGFTLWAIS